MSVQALAAIFGNRARGTLPHPARGSDRLVLLAIANHANEQGEAWPSVDTIAAEAQLSPRRVHDALRRLEAQSWIVRVLNAAPDERIRAWRRPNLYRILPLDAGPADPEWGGRSVHPTDATGVDSRGTTGVDENDRLGWTERPPNPSVEPSEGTVKASEAPRSAASRTEVPLIDGSKAVLAWTPPDAVTAAGLLPDAVRLCDVMAGQLAARGDNTAGRALSRRWVLDMEALLRLDHRRPHDVEKVLGWLDRGADEVAAFWRAHVRSPGKLRAKWTQMAEAWAAHHRRVVPRTPVGDDAAEILGRLYDTDRQVGP